jgi:hypothetical protein
VIDFTFETPEDITEVDQVVTIDAAELYDLNDNPNPTILSKEIGFTIIVPDEYV